MQQRAASGHMEHGFHIDWEPVRLWIERAIRSGRLAEISLTAATLTTFGWTVFALHKALQNYQVVGSSLF